MSTFKVKCKCLKTVWSGKYYIIRNLWFIQGSYYSILCWKGWEVHAEIQWGYVRKSRFLEKWKPECDNNKMDLREISWTVWGRCPVAGFGIAIWLSTQRISKIIDAVDLKYDGIQAELSPVYLSQLVSWNLTASVIHY